jgi:hypothetical protein
LFGGLGIWVAKTFLWIALIVLIVGLVAGFVGRGRMRA